MNSRDFFFKTFNQKPQATGIGYGRVNLIGEYTDICQGLVLPTLINLKIEISISQRKDFKIVGKSKKFGKVETSIDSKTDGSWADFVKGAIKLLNKEGLSLQGINLAVTSNLPTGAGLSSSAAFEVAIIKAIINLKKNKLSKKKIAQIGQLIEHDYVGTQCGIMDQMASVNASYGKAMLLDCKSLKIKLIKLFKSHNFAVIHSGVSRKLSKGIYNERKKETTKAAKILNKQSLRNAKISDLKKINDPIIFKRAKHIITENIRVKNAVKAILNDNAKKFGKLMNDSHDSLKNNFEVSSNSLDRLVETALEKGSLGARLTGAGFGGCVIALMPKTNSQIISKKIISKCKDSWLVGFLGIENI